MTRPKPALAGLIAAVAFATIAVGCSSAPPLRAFDYRRRAEQVCRDLGRRTAELSAPAGTSSDELVRAGRRTLSMQRGALGLLRGLDAPSADEHRIAQWLDAVDSALDAGAASLDAQARGDLDGARAANARGRDATARADALAHALGVADCAPVTTG